MTINSRFNNTLTTVRSQDGVTVYRRSVNQNPVYFVSYFGRVLHVGGRRHALRMFRKYRPEAAPLKAYTA